MMPPLRLVLLSAVFLSSFFLRAVEPHGVTVDNAEFKVVVEDGWLISWTNKRTGEVFDFGKPENAGALAPEYQPGPWVIKGYDQEAKEKSWSLTGKVAKTDEFVLQQQLDVKDGWAQTVQWSVRVPLDKIDAMYWPTTLGTRLISKDSQTPEAAIGVNNYFDGRQAVLSSHQWRSRFFVIQGQKGGLLLQVDDPELEHFSAVEAEASKFPKEIVLTMRSLASPPWQSRYESNKWTITQYDGWVNKAAKIRQDYLAKAFDLVPLKDRPTAWVQNLVYSYVRAPFNFPILNFPGTENPDYTQNWEENLKLTEDWLNGVAKVMDPDKVMFYVNWWRYAGHDTFFPDHSIDPFFAHAVGKARRMGFHVMLHFHFHRVHDAAAAFFGRYVVKQDEWHRAAYPNRPNAMGDPEGKMMWGVGVDFVRRHPMVRLDMDAGTPRAATMGILTKMSGYMMSPAYEGWRYMKAAEILSAVRATGADAVHIDVPAVWPEGKERFGLNSQQGSRELFKLLRKTLDENGLAHVAIAVEASPGEGYMKYVDFGQLVRGASTVTMLDGISVDTMMELQTGADAEKAKQIREAAKARYPTDEQRKVKEEFRFNAKGAGDRLAKVREYGEPNIDAMVISPYVRAYPHLGSSSPLLGGYKGDPGADVHNRAAVALHTWTTIQRDATFSSSPTFQMFLDKAPWEEMDIIKDARKANINSGKRTEGKIFSKLSYGEFALIRWWEKNQPRFAPLLEWEKGDVARFKLTDGSTLTARRSTPTMMTLAVDGKTLADLSVFEGWKNNEALMKDYAPTDLLDQIDRGRD